MSARTESNWPVRKVGAGGVAGAVTTVLVYILNTLVVPNQPIPADVATAFSSLLSFVVAFNQRLIGNCVSTPMIIICWSAEILSK